jgi:hypothetical protein
MFTEFPTSQACLRHKRPQWAATSDSHAGPMQDWQKSIRYQFYARPCFDAQRPTGFSKSRRLGLVLAVCVSNSILAEPETR